MRLTPDRCLLGRPSGDIKFSAFIGAEADLIKNIHGIASVAELDGDEVGYLLGRVATQLALGVAADANNLSDVCLPAISPNPESGSVAVGNVHLVDIHFVPHCVGR